MTFIDTCVLVTLRDENMGNILITIIILAFIKNLHVKMHYMRDNIISHNKQSVVMSKKWVQHIY